MSEADAGAPARAAAIALIKGALAHRGGIDEAQADPALNGLEARDRAFARALAMTVLRHLRPIDQALDARLHRPPPDAVRDLLRIGAAQLYYMGTPAHAAVATSVDLADRTKATRPFKGLVNAVLRGLAREGAPPVVDLAPEWIMARWRAAFGQDDARALGEAIADEPATDLTFRDPSDAVAMAEALEGGVLDGGSLRTRRRGDLSEWPGYAAGRWWVQDVSAAIPVRLLAITPGQSALDLCAAPGGKTLQLAAAGAQVVALDRSAARLARARENLDRTGLKAEVIVADVLSWPDERQFDAVLLDAPCTATGTFRRHPETLWAAHPSDVGKLAATQSRMLDRAAARTRSGGRLIYCVCSLEPEEGEAQVQAFLKRRPDFGIAPIAPGEGGAPPASVTALGTLRILPHHVEGGADGFFVARLIRS